MNKNKIKPNVKKVGLQQADIYKTHGNNFKIIRFLNSLFLNNCPQGMLLNTNPFF